MNLIKKIRFRLKKHTPQILVIFGIGTFVATVVSACKATTKLKEIEYNHTITKTIKLYTPTIILGVLSIGSFLASHNILYKRNLGLATAYVALNKTFHEYRRIGIRRYDNNECEDVLEDQNEYIRYFDKKCQNWIDNSEYNKEFLKQTQEYMNDKLRSEGYVFLNDVFNQIGLSKTKAGQVVGWIYNSSNLIGDNYIDFGIYDINKESTILLEFNVDGDIWELLNL